MLIILYLLPLCRFKICNMTGPQCSTKSFYVGFFYEHRKLGKNKVSHSYLKRKKKEMRAHQFIHNRHLLI